MLGGTGFGQGGKTGLQFGAKTGEIGSTGDCVYFAVARSHFLLLCLQPTNMPRRRRLFEDRREAAWIFYCGAASCGRNRRRMFGTRPVHCRVSGVHQGVQVVNSAGALRLPKWGSEELLLLEAGAPADAGAKALAGEAGVRAGA